jgi:hypothetical protein
MEQQTSHDTSHPSSVQHTTIAQTVKVLTVEQCRTATYRYALGLPLERAEYFLKHFCMNKAFLLQDIFAVIKKIITLGRRDKAQYAAQFGWARTVLDWAIILGPDGLPIAQQLIDGAGLRYMVSLHLDAQGDDVLHLAVYAHNKDLVCWLIQESKKMYLDKPFLFNVFVNRRNMSGYTALGVAQQICRDPSDSFFQINEEIIDILMAVSQ